MELLDPATGTALPNDAIQRILFLANAVHVYNIPPLTSTKGYSASTWTAEPQRHIFTARLRVVETAYESASSTNQLKVDAVLEDASSGQLFAAAPYTAPGVVEPVLDSSRFFALTVRDPQGRKAVLGIGFEERSEAFDLSIALQEARKALGWEGEQSRPSEAKEKEEHRDYSLKDGETITVSFGGSKFGRRKQQDSSPAGGSGSGGDLQSFALPPPPAGGSGSGGDLQSFALPPPPAGPGSSGGFSLPPPPSAQDVKQQKQQSAKDLGFDDGQFGEFA
ncbi:hypothetical protein FSARC_123 [Fusarium sarcochroum]|uniref:NECAP PHear domain-containing protein n=1 Tax=Fusarium sarcochroum TaxID=1208366 RepID=A0A8H4UCI2_9HYPO|nr:hypothetical protein FSARC_123 [Fusarium sarcochroum]